MSRKTASTTRRKTAPRRDAAKSTPPAEAQRSSGATDEDVATVIRSMTKRDLIDRVVEASGVKKKSAKPVIEAMLKELGDALSRGETLNLQPFGKGIVKSRKELENAEIVELRLRRSKLALQAAEAEDEPQAAGPDEAQDTGPDEAPATAAE